MPDNIGLYETRTMLTAIEQTLPAYSFLTDTFFSNTQNEQTEHIDADYRKGKRKMAPFVAPLQGGRVMERQGYETRTIKFPQIAPRRLLTIADLNTRLPGEAVYGGSLPEERAQKLLAQDMIELMEYIERRVEWMASQLLFTGKLLLKGENNYKMEADFKLTNSETLSAAKKWNVATGKPLDDLGAWRRKVIQKTGVAPDVCIMASDVADAYAANESVKEYHNLTNAFIGKYEPSIQNPAVTFIERITKLGLEVYSYDDWFIDDDGTEKPFVPAGSVLLAKKDARNTRHYGPVTQLEGQDFKTYFAPIVPKVSVNEDANTKHITLTSRPMLVPYDIDGWYTAKVL